MVGAESSGYIHRAIEEFKSRAEVLTKLLEKPGGIDNLSFGPTYHMTSSSGQQIDMNILSIHLPKQEGFPLMDNKRLVIFAIIGGKLVGFRTATLLDYSKYDYIDEERPDEGGYEVKARGESVTLERSKGVGSAMELIYQFLLQQEANEKGTSVVHRIDPANLRVLQILYDSINTEAEAQILEKKQAEAKRWDSIYGSSGSYGYQNYTRTFTPNSSIQTVPQNAHDVWLMSAEEDIDGQKVKTAHVTKTETQADPTGYQDEQKSHFMNVILPQLQG